MLEATRISLKTTTSSVNSLTGRKLHKQDGVQTKKNNAVAPERIKNVKKIQTKKKKERKKFENSTLPFFKTNIAIVFHSLPVPLWNCLISSHELIKIEL